MNILIPINWVISVCMMIMQPQIVIILFASAESEGVGHKIKDGDVKSQEKMKHMRCTVTKGERTSEKRPVFADARSKAFAKMDALFYVSKRVTYSAPVPLLHTKAKLNYLSLSPGCHFACVIQTHWIPCITDSVRQTLTRHTSVS